MKPPEGPAPNLLLDRPTSFGWISISLHWITATLVIAMWLIGKNMSMSLDDSAWWREVHITLGLGTWVLLAGRVVWRVVSKHPRTTGVTPRIHVIAKTTHYLMLTVLTLLITSGPITAFSGPGTSIGVAAFVVHRYAGDLMLILVITHILAAIKHLMFHQDDSFIRMLWPKR